MRKRIVSMALAVLLCLSLCTPARAARSDSPFVKKADYTGQFADVASVDWFSGYVKQSYEYGLLKGSSDTLFGPGRSFSIGEVITLAVRLHSIYTTGAEPNLTMPPWGSWYTPYVLYAVDNGLLAQGYDDYAATARRSELAVILSNALPDAALSPIRTVSDGYIPDVPMSAPYAAAVYRLYRAGVLSGSDASGSFRPDSGITRSEIAAISVRIADPTQRSLKALSTAPSAGAVLTAEEIAETCSPAVFFIQTYAFNGKKSGTGSGFFISSDGLAVTNHHVAANSTHLQIKTSDGTIYDNVRIIDMDVDTDLALLRVEGAGFPYLQMGDSASLKQGQTVYAIGSPLGLDNTLSQGLISNVSREFDGVRYVQISVPIAPGSSGGALLNAQGQVVGVTSAGFTNTTGDLNLAVPISQVNALNSANTARMVGWKRIYYPGFSQALDFGAFSGVKLLSSQATLLGYRLVYETFDFYDTPGREAGDNFANTLRYYQAALLGQNFIHTVVDDLYLGTYKTDTEGLEILATLTGNKTIDVSVWRVPQFYAEYPQLPDFGWYAFLETLAGAQEYDDATEYVYNWSDYYTFDEFMYLLEDYTYLLELSGYELQDSNSTKLLYSGNGEVVMLILQSTKFCVAVLKL